MYRFSIDDFIYVKIDLTFIEASSCQEVIEDVVYWVRGQVELVPSLKPIILIIKRILLEKGLNSPFNGGLASFSCIMMVLAYLKSYRSQFIGNDLLGLLDFYSKFDHERFLISSEMYTNYLGYLNLAETQVLVQLFITH